MLHKIKIGRGADTYVLSTYFPQKIVRGTPSGIPINKGEIIRGTTLKRMKKLTIIKTILKMKKLKCSKCCQIKPETSFHVKVASKTGRNCYCKPCKKLYDKQYRQKHRKLQTVQHKVRRYEKRIKELINGGTR